MAWGTLSLDSVSSSKSAGTTIPIAASQFAWTADRTYLAFVVCDNLTSSTPTLDSVSKPGTESNNWTVLESIPSSVASAASSVVGYIAGVQSSVNASVFSSFATLSASVAVRVAGSVRDITGGSITKRFSSGQAKGTSHTGITANIGDLMLILLAGETNSTPGIIDATFGGGFTAAGWNAIAGTATTGGGAAGNAGMQAYWKIADADITAGTFAFNPSYDGGSSVVVLQPGGPTLTPVTSSRSFLWNVRSAVSSQTSLLWNIKSAVNSSLSLLWNVAAEAALTPVTSSRSLLWDVRAPVSSSLGVSWNVKAAVNSSLNLLWNVTAGALGSPAIFVSSSRSGATDSFAGTNTCPVPSGTSAGMVAILAMEIFLDSPITPTWPSGFTQVVDSRASGVQLLIAKKTLTGADSGNYVTTLPSARWNQSVCVLVSDAVTVSTPDANSLKTGVGTNIASLSLTSANPPVLVHFQANSSAGSHTPPTDFTERQEGEYITVATHEPGTTGTHSTSGASQTASTGWAAALISIEGGEGSSLTPVSSSLSLSWNVKAGVSSDKTLSWNVKSGVATNRVLVWNIRAGVQSQRTVLWNVKQSVNSSLTLRWGVKAGVPSSRTILWNVISPFVGVGNSLSLMWNVRGGVPASRTLLWNVRAGVTSGRTLQWNVKAAVNSLKSLSWNVRSGVPDSLSLQWNVRSGIQDSLALRWDVRSGVQDSLDLRWSVKGGVQSTLDVRWNVLGESTGLLMYKRVDGAWVPQSFHLKRENGAWV